MADVYQTPGAHAPVEGTPLINSRLEFIALSNNKIENINQNAFRNLSSLHTLDLSDNNLSLVKAFERTFDALFRYNQHLESVDLSNNKLQWLPKGTFHFNNHLTYFNLSHNLFQQITFNMSVLLDLATLDLSYNSILSLNENSRTRLDTLYKRQTQQYNAVANKKGIRVLLTGNPFSCSCSSLDFIRWFVVSPIFSATRNDYHCKLDGKNTVMGDAAVTVSMEDCRKTKRRRLIIVLSSTIPTIFVLASAVVIVLLCKRRKRKLFHRLFEDKIRRLRNDTSHFPVLLSYSSQDNEFVEQHILQQLQQHLQAVTMIDRDLVCNAERHFVPGRPILSEIFRCLRESEVFVAVISRNYCNSRFCHYEIDHAHLLKKPIILIFMEHVEEVTMNLATREAFETFTRAKFVLEDGEYKIKPDWPEICEAIIQLMQR